MKKIVLSAIALSALAGAAHGQIDPSRFRLEVSPIIRAYSADNGDGTFNVDDVGTSATVNTRTSEGGGAVKVRIELRYRIVVTNSTTGSYTFGGSTFSSGGLASASINLGLSQSLGSSALLAPAAIGATGGNTGTGFLTSDVVDTGSGYGVYAPWRTGSVGTGFGGNNGTLNAAGTQVTNILPLATGAPDQRSGTNATAQARRWSFYAMDINLPADYGADQTVVTISAIPNLDASGGQAPWLFFPRVGSANASSAITAGGNITGGSVSLTILGREIPAPGSVALLGLGGLVAARRRRN